MSDNKDIKNLMISKYGKKCFIEELHLRTPQVINQEKRRYTGKKQRAIMDELTFHHIIPKCKGGKATEENGAILRNINHIWFNRLNKERQAEINQLFKEYKKIIVLNVAELTTEGIKQTKQIIIEEPKEYIKIPLEDNDYQDLEYLEHKRKRNERVFKKFKEWER